MKYAELNLVRHTATGGKQDHVTLMSKNDITFEEVKGQVGITIGARKPTKTVYPISEWDNILASYLEKGYYQVPGLDKPAEKKVVKKNASDHTKEPTEDAQELINLLCALANQAAAQTFSLSISDVTKEQVEVAKAIFKELAEGYLNMSTSEFNNELCKYFSIVPRRMRRPNDHMAKGTDKNGCKLDDEKASEERGMILTRELDLFNTMLDLLKGEDMMKGGSSYSSEYGLDIRRVTPEEEAYIKRKLTGQSDRYRRAWRVTNNSTQKAFDRFCEANGLTDENKGIAHLWHGSRGENFLSILISGLKCNPQNALTGETPIICGKAYGLGIYMAKDAVKSLGYTDSRGSKWANGTQECGYLLLNKAAVGKPHTQFNGDINRMGSTRSSFNWKRLKEVNPDALCTWAEARYSGFFMDEIIVYQDCQVTPEFLVEVAA